MDFLEVLNYLADKYNFADEDMNLVDEITNQIVNSEYEDDKDDDYEDKDYEDEGEYDEEDYDIAEER